MLYSNTMKVPKIVIVGHVCIDRNVSEHATYTSWGSTVLYMADFMQRTLGVTPQIITRYGRDFTPYDKDFNLYPATPQEPKTLLNENVSKEGHADRWSHHTEFAGAPTLDNGARDILAEADVLIFASLLANYSVRFVEELVAAVPQKCLKVLTLQGYLRNVDEYGVISARDFVEAPALLPLFDLVTFSRHDIPRAFETARTWQNLGPAVVVTEGEKGATIFAAGKETAVPTVPIPEEKIIDSVGCGDVFGGALSYYYFAEKDIIAAVQQAHKAARAKLFALAGDADGVAMQSYNSKER